MEARNPKSTPLKAGGSGAAVSASAAPQTATSTTTTAATLTASNNTTSIEQVFRHELLFIKICGGFMFDRPPFCNILYRALVVILTKLLFTSSIQYPRFFNSFSKATTQNLNFFRTSYYIVSYIVVLASFITGLKYHNLILVVLKKRFDKRYLNSLANNDSEHNPTSWQNNSGKRSRKAQSTSTTTTTTSRDETSRPHLLPASFESTGDDVEPASSTITKFLWSSSRVVTVRRLLIANLLITTLVCHYRDQIYATLEIRRPDLHNQQQQNNNYNSILNQSTTMPAIGMTSIEPTPTSPTETTTDDDNRVATTIAQDAGPRTLLATATTSAQIGTDRRQVPTNLQPEGLKEMLLSFIDEFLNNFYYKRLAEGYIWLKNAVRSLPTATPIFGIFLEFFRSALAINQLYGQLFIVLMVTATITDMLSYSYRHDVLLTSNELAQNTTGKYRVHISGSKLSAAAVNSSQPASPRLPLLTTELLIQVRDVLIILRYIMSLEYLTLLIYELTQLMSVFCLFNASASRFDIIIVIFLDYLRISFSMSLNRLGYKWLHDKVRKLKRVVDERNLLQNVQFEKHLAGSGSSLGLTISRSERITTYRLADDIDTLWPTDWYTPDFKSYLKHNILVITFVATLQQLADASLKIEYQTNTASTSNILSVQ